MKQGLNEFLVALKKKGVPLASLATADQGAAVRKILDTIYRAAKEGSLGDIKPRFFVWSRSLGLSEAVPVGEAPIWEEHRHEGTDDPLTFLREAAPTLPPGSTVVVRNGHWLLSERVETELLQYVRDWFEADQRTMILLGPSFQFPEEIRRDFISYTEPLPGKEERIQIVRSLCESNEVPFDEESLIAAASLSGGLSRFTVRQATAMALRKGGIDRDVLWERKKEFVTQAEGLRFYEDDLTLDIVGGNRNVIRWSSELIKDEGVCKILHIDELDKTAEGFVGGHEVGANQHERLLGLLDPRKGVRAIAFTGIPGTGKTLIAQLLGATFHIPTILFQMSLMRGHGLVGQAEHAIDAAIEAALAAVDGPTLVIATTNRHWVLSPELRDRLQPTFFFDYPDREEKDAIWRTYRKMFNIPDQPLPDDDGWSGRNIYHCCLNAKKRTLVEAAKFIVRSSDANAAEVKQMRDAAKGTYISSSYEGLYRGPAVSSERRVTL